MANEPIRKNLLLTDEEPTTGLSRWIPTIIVFCVVAGFFSLSWYAYHAGMQSVKEEDLLVVEADKTPMKEKPTDPGGMQFPNQEKTIFETFGGNKVAAQKVERILPTPEEPMPKNMDTSETTTWVKDAKKEPAAAKDASKEAAKEKVVQVTEQVIGKTKKPEEDKESAIRQVIAAPSSDTESFVAGRRDAQGQPAAAAAPAKSGAGQDYFASEKPVPVDDADQTKKDIAAAEEELRQAQARAEQERAQAEKVLKEAEAKVSKEKTEADTKLKAEAEKAEKELAAKAAKEEKLNKEAEAKAKAEAEKADKLAKAEAEKAEKLAKAEAEKAEKEAAAKAAKEEKLAKEAAAKEAKEKAAEAKAAEAKSVEAKPASAPASSGAAATIQLGAYRSEEEAQDAWQKMHLKHKELSDQQPTVVRADLGEKGIYYRLRVTALDDAKSVCASISGRGQPCILVTGK